MNACLDIQQSRWIFKVNNLKIPVFSSSCVNGLIDIGNGCDVNVLSREITSRAIYNDLLDDIKWWKEGPYSHTNSRPKRFAFSAGIEAHEDWHLSLDVINAVELINGSLRNIYNLQYPKLDYPCETNVLEQSGDARSQVNKAIEDAFNRYDKMDQVYKEEEELRADKYARTEYNLILICVEEWAKSQQWY
jgi:hypothetical protein